MGRDRRSILENTLNRAIRGCGAHGYSWTSTKIVGLNITRPHRESLPCMELSVAWAKSDDELKEWVETEVAIARLTNGV